MLVDDKDAPVDEACVVEPRDCVVIGVLELTAELLPAVAAVEDPTPVLTGLCEPAMLDIALLEPLMPELVILGLAMPELVILGAATVEPAIFVLVMLCPDTVLLCIVDMADDCDIAIEERREDVPDPPVDIMLDVVGDVWAPLVVLEEADVELS